jgi:cytoskeleton protein RodZ
MFEIGRSLREARTRRGLDLPQIEHDTHIRAKFLSALEEDQFDVLPGPAYAKGFLRTYADYLGLDAQQFVDEYNSRFAAEEDPTAPPLVEIPRRRRIDTRLLALPLVALLALIGWQLARGSGKPRAHALQAAQHQTTTQSVTTITRAVSTAPTHRRLVLTAARGRCWLMVRRASESGPLVFESTLAQGQTVRFTVGRLWIRVGAPWNVDATLSGKPLPMPSAIGNVVVTPTGTSPG